MISSIAQPRLPPCPVFLEHHLLYYMHPFVNALTRERGSALTSACIFSSMHGSMATLLYSHIRETQNQEPSNVGDRSTLKGSLPMVPSLSNYDYFGALTSTSLYRQPRHLKQTKPSRCQYYIRRVHIISLHFPLDSTSP